MKEGDWWGITFFINSEFLNFYEIKISEYDHKPCPKNCSQEGQCIKT